MKKTKLWIQDNRMAVRWEKGKTTHYSILAWGISWTEKAMAPHSSTLAWKIIWMEEPGKLQSMGSLRVRHG